MLTDLSIFAPFNFGGLPGFKWAGRPEKRHSRAPAGLTAIDRPVGTVRNPLETQAFTGFLATERRKNDADEGVILRRGGAPEVRFH